MSFEAITSAESKNYTLLLRQRDEISDLSTSLPFCYAQHHELWEEISKGRGVRRSDHPKSRPDRKQWLNWSLSARTKRRFVTSRRSCTRIKITEIKPADNGAAFVSWDNRNLFWWLDQLRNDETDDTQVYVCQIPKSKGSTCNRIASQCW